MAIIIRMNCFSKKDYSFLEFMNTLAESFRTQGRLRTAETYRSTMKSFRRFLNGEDINMSEICPELMMQYEGHLRKQGLTLNTVSFYMRILRASYNRCVEEGLCVQCHPFQEVYTGVDKTRKRAISQNQVSKIKNAPLDDTPNICFARDMFMFSLYTRGMSFVDMAYLRKKDVSDGMLVYRRKKTGQLLTVKWEKCMQTITDKYSIASSPYLLPLIKHSGDERKQYLSALRQVNNNLKLLSAKIGCDNLTTYVARHTWASLAHSKNIPISLISEGMGHTSESTTRVYLQSLDTSLINKMNKKIIEDL